MKKWTVVTWGVALFIACGGPTSTVETEATPHLETQSEESQPTAEQPAESSESTEPEEEEQEPPIQVVELETSATVEGEGNLVEEGTVARLVPLGNGLQGYAGRIAGKIRRSLVGSGRGDGSAAPTKGMAVPSEIMANPMSSDTAASSRPARPASARSGSAAQEESITNTQVAGVDEGGIVKAWREFFVVLRRGRLFTVRLGDDSSAVTPISAIDVRPPRSTHDAWYDEMLIHSPTGTIVVVGFNYDHEATEIGLFNVAPDGALSYRQTHLLRSNDYYSSRNYASRLIGDTLVFYMPHYLISHGYDERRDVETVSVSMPSTRGFARGNWRSIVRASEVYRIGGDLNSATLHTVVTCDLSASPLRCRARGIIGGEGRTFYVSRDAVYVWVVSDYPPWELSDAEYERLPDPSEQPSHLFRLPLDGSRPSVLVVRGAPIDQFSFNETPEELWVMVRAQGGGDAMWAPELPSGSLGLLRVPLSSFGRNVRSLSSDAYRTLPSPGSGSLQNRFIGDYVLFGGGTSWGRRGYLTQIRDRVYLHQYRNGRTFAVSLLGGVDRIEALVDDAVVIGTDGENLHFRSFALESSPRAIGHYVRQGAAQGETRSHGFFYKPTGERQGVLGLPLRGAGRPGVEQLRHGSAEVLYLSAQQLQFSELGALRSGTGQQQDRCQVSCVDWYGNSRPLFYRGRVFALLGYELVEGSIANGTITEVGRTNLLTALPQ